MPKLDTALLNAALVGYQHQLTEIDAQIAAIRKRLGTRAQVVVDEHGGGEAPGPFPRKRWKMSAAGKRRIAEAQRRRWMKVRSKK